MSVIYMGSSDILLKFAWPLEKGAVTFIACRAYNVYTWDVIIRMMFLSL